jgi:hypothetical protein
MKRRIIVWITLLIVVFTVAGCSGGNSGSTSTTLNASSQSQSPQSGSSGSAQQSSGSGDSQKPQIKPEQLISKEEAATLLGEAVKKGATDEFPQLSLSITFYAAENMESKNYLQIAVMQQASDGGGGGGGGSEQSASSQPSESGSSSPSGGSGGSGEKLAPKDIFEGLKKLFSDPFAPAEGRMGDDFFLSAQGLSILHGGQYIYISVGSFPAAEAQKLLKQAGELAIINLKRIQGE